MLFGYAHPAYAASLARFGTPRALGASGAWVLQRPIAPDGGHDAMGCYPLFVAPCWGALERDLAVPAHDWISLGLVPDPLSVGEANEPMLRRCFGDVMRPFKQHYVVELDRPLDAFVAAHHRRNARKALRAVVVERCEPSPAVLQEWITLYDHLIQRHAIRGIAAFGDDAFARQFAVPGLTIVRARQGDATVGMALWYRDGERAYYHLAAYNDAGYHVGAAFALFWTALDSFRSVGVRIVNLGAGAGTSAGTDDGLTRFKRGWASGTRTAFFCGRIFDRERYDALVRARGITPGVFFPAYRTGAWT